MYINIEMKSLLIAEFPVCFIIFKFLFTLFQFH